MDKKPKNLWLDEYGKIYTSVVHEPKKDQITGSALRYLMDFINDCDILLNKYKEYK